MNKIHSTSRVHACQNCKKDFEITENDRLYYEKINVPHPTWCPECRMNRRLAFGNSWGVYFRNCDKCGDKTLTMYRPESTLVVYCDPCWWADEWDGTEYAVDYDPSRNFLEQWKELRSKTPHFAKDALYLTLKNCEYTNAIAYSKNCYMSFWADYCENIFYSSILNSVKDSVDILRSYKTELSYESVGLGKCSKTYFSNTCDDSVDVWFSRNCYNCTNCVGCVNLRGATNYIFNVKYSKEEYEQKIKEFKLDTRNGIEEMQSLANNFWQTLPYREYTGNSQNLNVSGDYIFESKNAQSCYTCMGVEDSKYCQFISVPKANNCMDYYGWGNGAELIYECAATGEDVQNIKFSFGMFGSGMDEEYCGFVIGGKFNFGCSNLKRKKYCILNKEYTKEEYEKLKTQIIADMKINPYVDSVGHAFPYGEFFPPEFSPFIYNDSNASRFFEKSKEQALSEGYLWKEKPEREYTKTISGNDLPQSIAETDESIMQEVIECTSCARGYKITRGEFDLYKRLGVPAPSKCPKCREDRRFAQINMPKFHNSNCSKCEKSISTMHDPSQNKIIYCEKCYQQEFI